MDRTLCARARVGEGANERSNEQRLKSFMTVAALAEIHGAARDSGLIRVP